MSSTQYFRHSKIMLKNKTLVYSWKLNTLQLWFKFIVNFICFEICSWISLWLGICIELPTFSKSNWSINVSMSRSFSLRTMLQQQTIDQIRRVHLSLFSVGVFETFLRPNEFLQHSYLDMGVSCTMFPIQCDTHWQIVWKGPLAMVVIDNLCYPRCKV
jgi:hypothetical protein